MPLVWHPGHRCAGNDASRLVFDEAGDLPAIDLRGRRTRRREQRDSGHDERYGGPAARNAIRASGQHHPPPLLQFD